MIKKELFELHKPSELTQVVCMSDDKNFVGSLNAKQIDIMNFLLYQSNKKIKENKIDTVDEFFYVEIPLIEFNKTLEQNNANVYFHIIENLTELKKQLFIFNALNKNKEIETSITSFIHKIKFTRHKLKRVQLYLDGEIIKLLLRTNKMFTKFYLKIQFSMKSKYSKLLYEILRDYLGRNYQGIKSITIDFELLIGLLNVDINKPTNQQWSTFRANILKKAIKEINEKSDIKVEYEAIKERTEDNPRLHVTKIKFTMEKQNDERLKELGLLNQEPELSIEEEIYLNKLRLKSKNKLEQLIQSGYEVKDKDSWIKADIKKNEKQYAAELDLDEYLEDLSTEDKRSLYFDLAKYLKLDEPLITIDNHCVKDFSNKFYTTSAEETITVINEMLDKD